MKYEDYLKSPEWREIASRAKEIRHAMKAAAFNNDSGHLDLLVSALKAPCMEIYK
jgi:hypothetical protein